MPTKRARKVHLNPLHHEHIAPEYLPNVNTYKYSGVDNSILSRFVMQYYWTAAVELLPMWLAPNVVTLLGFIISASSTLLVLGFDIIDRWGFDGSLRGSIPAGEYPSWVWYYAAIALFAYQTLDALDGKQARRTKSGSPMGELFDHGCDAFFTPLLQVNLCVALGLTPSVRFVFFLLVTSGLLFAIWEQFVTGTLDFGYITGPTEGILLTCWIFWATGYYGPAIWATPLTSFALHWSSPAFAIGSLQIPSYPLVAMSTWGDALFYLTVTAVILTVIGNVAHVITRPRVKSHPFGVSITSLAPNVVVVVMFVWYQCTFEQVSLQAPFMVELCYGFLASYTATRLTVSRLCGMPYRPISTFYVATVLCVGLPAAIARIMPDVVNAKDPSTCSILISLLYILLAIGIAQYAHLIVSVFNQLSTFLKIDIFKVKKQQ